MASLLSSNRTVTVHIAGQLTNDSVGWLVYHSSDDQDGPMTSVTME